MIPAPAFRQLPTLRRACVLSVAIMLFAVAAHPRAQDEPQPTLPDADAAPASTPAAVPARPAAPTVWDLMIQGGIFMIPIFGCSIIVVAFTIERFIGLRRKKTIPPRLLQGLEEQTSQTTGLDPRAAYRLCQQYKSPMANVLRAGLLKIGRPHAEVEKAVEDAGAREAAAMFSNVRPLNVCTSVGPLLGLLGTVQGMIMAFIVTSTTTATGAAKAQELAQGIYTALVTTFAGLSVAIPGVLFAHYFEGRIDRLVREMEEILLDILPHLERFEGKTRLQRVARAGATQAGKEAAPAQESAVAAGAPAVAAANAPGSSGVAMSPTSRK